jgi:hypothetical protein
MRSVQVHIQIKDLFPWRPHVDNEAMVTHACSVVRPLPQRAAMIRRCKRRVHSEDRGQTMPRSQRNDARGLRLTANHPRRNGAGRRVAYGDIWLHCTIAYGCASKRPLLRSRCGCHSPSVASCRLRHCACTQRARQPPVRGVRSDPASLAGPLFGRPLQRSAERVGLSGSSERASRI